MQTLFTSFVAVAALLLALGANAQTVPAAADESDEFSLARELIAERYNWERMRADPGVTKEALLAQERKLMAIRARLSAVLARELAQQSTDADQWKDAFDDLKDYLRDKLRSWLDEERAREPGSRGI